MNKQQMIRQMYSDMHYSIMENYPKTDPNFFDWTSIMSVAEKFVWSEIRSIGLPMFPQFPVLGYFVDFADPVKKIAIEVDGREFHKDYAKDNKRQREIESGGWTFYRIEGWEVQPVDDGEEDPLRRFLKRIKDTHYQ